MTFAGRTILTLATLLAVSGGVLAGQKGEGFSFWLDLARAGDSEAQYRVANRYRDGRDVDPDPTEALRWYRRAAEQGHAKAENNLGLMYAKGFGVEPDDLTAADWYRRAAERGLAVAQFNLASMYAAGRGVGRDEAQAFHWFRAAASQGYAEAQFQLALRHAEGRGTAVDTAAAFRWFLKAARQDHVEAQARVGRAYADGAGVKQNAAKARKWLARAGVTSVAASEPATAGAPGPAGSPNNDEEGRPSDADDAPTPGAEPLDANDAYEVGRDYAMGRGGRPRDHVRAAEWYRRAAEQGHLMAWYRLGFLAMDGKGVSGKKDFVQAHMWFALCAQRGLGDAGRWLAKLTKKMTESEVAESRQRQQPWNERFPAEGDRRD